MSSYQLALIVGAVLIVLAIERGYRTRAGKAIMAVAEDRDAALLRGINPERLSRWSFFLGGMFAALTGLLAAPLLYASTGLGPLLLIKGFEGAAVGGIGDNRGALVAGYLLGITEAIGATLLSPGYQTASTFVLLLVILLSSRTGSSASPRCGVSEAAVLPGAAGWRSPSTAMAPPARAPRGVPLSSPSPCCRGATTGSSSRPRSGSTCWWRSD